MHIIFSCWCNSYHTLLITCVIHPIISIYAIAIFLFTRFNRHALIPTLPNPVKRLREADEGNCLQRKSPSAMFCCQLDHVFRWVGVIKTSLFRITVLDRILGISIQMGEESLFLISVGYWCNIWLMISVMSKNKKMIGTPYMFITMIICINHVHYDRVLQNEWIINKWKHGWCILKNYIC